MRKSFLLSLGLAAAGFGMMAAGSHLVERAAPPPVAVRHEVRRQRMPDGSPYSSRRRRKPGPGWTVRQVQRMATKRRNQARNRRAHRGCKGRR